MTTATAPEGTLGKYLRADQLKQIAERDGRYKRRIANLVALLEESERVQFAEALRKAAPSARCDTVANPEDIGFRIRCYSDAGHPGEHVF